MCEKTSASRALSTSARVVLKFLFLELADEGGFVKYEMLILF